MGEQLKLSELNKLIREKMLDAFPGSLWVVAEISELKINRTGHCYLELIEHDNDEIVARARATVWSYTFRMLKPYFETTTGQLFSQGIKILVNVTVEFHSVYGLSLNIRDIDPTYTIGDLVRQRNEIIKRLKQAGVFDMNRELSLPLVPQRIAVISSSTTAGYLDFMNELENNRNKFRFFVTLFEATMQGEEAPSSILNAFDRIFAAEDQFDLVVIIRGGGAVADLNCFDNYDLAFAVTQFPLPVVTGIGHEKDDTITDLVAHTRLKTPTAVAEFLVQGLQRFLDHLEEKTTEVIHLVKEITSREEIQIERLAGKVIRSGTAYLGLRSGQVSQLVSRLHRGVQHYNYKNGIELNNIRHRLTHLTEIFIRVNQTRADTKIRNLEVLTGRLLVRKEDQVARGMENLRLLVNEMIIREKTKLKGLSKNLQLLKPEVILKRGYTLSLQDGKIVKRLKDLQPESEMETRFSDGSAFSEIKKKLPK